MGADLASLPRLCFGLRRTDTKSTCWLGIHNFLCRDPEVDSTAYSLEQLSKSIAFNCAWAHLASLSLRSDFTPVCRERCTDCTRPEIVGSDLRSAPNYGIKFPHRRNLRRGRPIATGRRSSTAGSAVSLGMTSRLVSESRRSGRRSSQGLGRPDWSTDLAKLRCQPAS